MTDRDTSSQPAEPATDHRGLRRLGFDECLSRLRDAKVGRIAFATGGEVVVLPVNPFVDDMTILFRTSWGSKLLAAERAEKVAFEVDDFDPAMATGWSVVVQGTLRVIDGDDECARLELVAPPPWLPQQDESFWVAIQPYDVSGRELIPDDTTAG